MTHTILTAIFPLFKLNTSDQQRALEIHNNARQQVGVPPLSWSDNLASDAQAYAEMLARTHRLEHVKTDYGENLYWYSGTTNTLGEDALRWLEEVKDYHHGRNWARNFPEVGQYTQMVWSKTE